MILRDIRPLLERLNPKCTALLEQSLGQCVSREQYEVRFEHLLAAALDDSDANDIVLLCAHYKVDTGVLKRAIARDLETLTGGNTGKPAFCPRLLEVLQEGWTIASLAWGGETIRSAALLAAALRAGVLERNFWSAALSQIPVDAILQNVGTLCAASSEQSVPVTAVGSGAKGSETASGPLGQFCTDFTELVRQGKIDTILGRDDEIRQVLDIVTRRRKNNPILVGDAGVGKTAVVEGLALRMVQGDVPAALAGASLYGLDMGLLQAGAGVKGEFEKRLKSVIDAVKAMGDKAILFIDEAHTLIGAGGAAGQNDAANLLKPALARGELRTLAATTWSEYRRYFEKDPALARRFQLVAVDEPDNERCKVMLRGIAGAYEKFHGVIVTDEAIDAAVTLSRRFISGRQLPDKAVDVLDTAATRVRMSRAVKPSKLDAAQRELRDLLLTQERLEQDRAAGMSTVAPALERLSDSLQECRDRIAVLNKQWEHELSLAEKVIGLRATRASGGSTAELELALGELLAAQGEKPMVYAHVSAAVCAQVIGDWTGIPVGSLMRNEAVALLELESRMRKRVVGQEDALKGVCSAVRAAKSGMRSPDAPLGVFLFAGPSGVGKTECALTLAQELFGGEKFLTIINMSEYREQHTTSQLKGSPPGYVGYGEGGVLTEAVRQKPYSLVLLDEVEKAHRDVMNLFYQVFDKGVMRDGEGREIDFRNTLIVMTSNLGTGAIAALCAQDPQISFDELTAAIRPELTDHFLPALLGRCRVIPFRPLDTQALVGVITLKTSRIVERIKQVHGITCTFTPQALDQIAAGCTVSQSGARDIDTVLEQQVLPQVSHMLLSHLGKDENESQVLQIGYSEGYTVEFVAGT